MYYDIIVLKKIVLEIIIPTWCKYIIYIITDRKKKIKELIIFKCFLM